MTLDQVFEEMELMEKEYPWFCKGIDAKILSGMITFSDPDDYLTCTLNMANDD